VSGKCWPGSSDSGAEARQGGSVLCDRVGLPLDTTTGSLSVFLNSVFRGLMMKAGLLGRCRWAVSMRGVGDCVRPDRARPSASAGPSRLVTSGYGLSVKVLVKMSTYIARSIIMLINLRL
jgi:hypothetical protein